jgi:hypothetical protein
MCAQLPANETSVCYIYLKQKMHLLWWSVLINDEPMIW